MESADNKLEKREYDHIFSVVIAVYNCEPFLRETLDSILNQNIEGLCKYRDGEETDEPITFEELCEVIMVDDGSKDGSGDICDEYAEKYENFKVIHKENGGVASARNRGLLEVSGKYMNFLDSDDKFSENVFREIYKFFEKNYDKTDVVTMPLRFFDAAKGPHWQNYKFKKHARIANLFNDYDCPLMFVNASFFKSEYKDKVAFNGKLVCGEDIRFIFEILPEKMTMGLVPYCHYEYRRRSAGEESLIQSSKKKLGWYFDYLEHLTEWMVGFCKQKWGYIPNYYQHVAVCDLQWRFLNEYEDTALAVLGEELFEEYKKRLYSVLSNFDDKIILGQHTIFNEHKCMMLTKKYGELPERCVYDDDVLLRFQNTPFRWASSFVTNYDFITVDGGYLTIEGYTLLYGYPEDTEVEIYFELTDTTTKEKSLIPAEITNRDVDKYRLGELLYKGVPFKLSIPVKELPDCKLALMLSANGEKIIKKNLRYGRFSPIGKEYKNSYYYSEGYMVSCEGHFIVLRRASKKDARRQEKAFRRELKFSKNLGAKKASIVRKLLSVFNFFKRKEIWIIQDRLNKAGDNGEALFRYLKEAKPKGIKPYFAITRCEDAKKLEPLGGVLYRDTKKFKLMMLAADYIISASGDEFALNPFADYSAPYRDIRSRQRFVFLQHGITEKDISGWLNRYNKNIFGFITAAKRETQSILEYAYHYDKESVWETGFARFDRLYNNEKKHITLMPTWRMYLAAGTDDSTGVWHLKPGFTNSTYFKFYNALINNEELLTACEEYDYKLCFMPHPNIIPHIALFDKDPRVEFYTINKEYRDVYAESDLVLTDYSSAVFDFAYMRKPVVYAQFDYDEFFSGEHVATAGYFSYENDGFGEVTKTLEETVATLIDYIKNGCKLKEIYRQRADGFFAYNDKENCKRITEKIISASKKQDPVL